MNLKVRRVNSYILLKRRECLQYCFITEESMQNLQNSNLYVEEDQDNFDYIFSVSELVALQGSKFKGKRHLAEGFLREYPDVLLNQESLAMYLYKSKSSRYFVVGGQEEIR